MGGGEDQGWDGEEVGVRDGIGLRFGTMGVERNGGWSVERPMKIQLNGKAGGENITSNLSMVYLKLVD